MPHDSCPDFVRESLAGAGSSEDPEVAELVNVLALGLPRPGAPLGVRERLLSETSSAPERYAPFARQLGELFDLPRQEVSLLLERCADARAWSFSGLPGVKKVRVSAGPATRGARAYLIKLSAGVRFPRHHHDGLETAVILAGGYVDDSGRRFATGDTHLMSPGTSHHFTIDPDEDCVAATVLHGRLSFHSRPLRWLARLLGH